MNYQLATTVLYPATRLIILKLFCYVIFLFLENCLHYKDELFRLLDAGFMKQKTFGAYAVLLKSRA